MDAVTDKVETAANEHLVLDMVDKFLATEVKPHVHALEHDDIYPAAIVEKMKEMGLFGATIARRIRRPRPVGHDLRQDRRAASRRCGCRSAGIFNSHLIMALVVQRNGTEAAEGGVPAALRDRRAARRPGAHRARLRHRPAGDPHAAPARGDRLRRQRHQDLDHQRHLRQDASRCWSRPIPTAEPRHKGMSLLIAEKGPGFTVEPQAREARLQGHRYLPS